MGGRVRVAKIPAHGTAGRYRGGKSFEPCRCSRCTNKHKADGKAYREGRKGGLADVLSPAVAKAIDEASSSHGWPDGSVYMAVMADLDALDLPGRTGKSQRAIALALAREIDSPLTSSRATAARQLRETLAAIEAAAPTVRDDLDDELAAMRSRSSSLPA